LITHDLGVVSGMADRVAVMYAGQIVEEADRETFFSEPRHPYSRKLFAALPDSEKREQRLTVIPGSVPPLNRVFAGCRFADRCDRAWEQCNSQVPQWIDTGSGQGVRCHLADPAVTPPASAEGTPPAREEGRGFAVPEAGRDQLLQVEDLQVHFPIQKGFFKRTVGHVKAVDGVDMAIPRGQTLALVGESGCGKTTVGKGILQLLKPTAGRVLFEDAELTQLKGEALRVRRRDFQIIFQDPFSSMNPRMSVGDIIEEGMIAQRIGGSGEQRKARVQVLLEQVGLRAEHARRYPDSDLWFQARFGIGWARENQVACQRGS